MVFSGDFPGRGFLSIATKRYHGPLFKRVRGAPTSIKIKVVMSKVVFKGLPKNNAKNKVHVRKVHVWDSAKVSHKRVFAPLWGERSQVENG